MSVLSLAMAEVALLATLGYSSTPTSPRFAGAHTAVFLSYVIIRVTVLEYGFRTPRSWMVLTQYRLTSTIAHTLSLFPQISCPTLLDLRVTQLKSTKHRRSQMNLLHNGRWRGKGWGTSACVYVLKARRWFVWYFSYNGDSKLSRVLLQKP